jgi:hypothetical protein
MGCQFVSLLNEVVVRGEVMMPCPLYEVGLPRGCHTEHHDAVLPWLSDHFPPFPPCPPHQRLLRVSSGHHPRICPLVNKKAPFPTLSTLFDSPLRPRLYRQSTSTSSFPFAFASLLLDLTILNREPPRVRSIRLLLEVKVLTAKAASFQLRAILSRTYSTPDSFFLCHRGLS